MKKSYILSLFLLSALIVNAQGIYQFWGITQYGGSGNSGVIFTTQADGTNLQNRYSFPLSNAGGRPQYTELTEYNGKFYGMTSQGGANSGVLFEYDPATNIYIKRVDFIFTNGGQPYGSLTLYNNKLYGMTVYGGTNGEGVLFEFDPSTYSYMIKKHFDGTNGGRPYGSLTAYNGMLYGMTKSGGSNGYGVLFQFDPATAVYTKKKDFDGTNGGSPVSSMTVYNGKLYGLTPVGGSYSGVIFEYDPALNTLVKKIDLTNSTGYNPQGYLTVYNNKMYATANYGGPLYGNGTLFEYDPASNTCSRKVDFNYGSNGYYPVSSLTVQNNKLYGTNIYGGANGNGVLFEYEPVAGSYTKKIDFNASVSGRNPFGAMMLYNGKLYGLTSEGGSSNNGILFEYDASTGSLTKRFDFSTTPDGGNALGELVSYKGNFYGMTRSGGAFNTGVIFKFDPATGVYSNLLDFTGTNGANPYAGLTIYNDKFYGTTLVGGVNGTGVLFEFDPLTNVYVKKIDFPAANTNGIQPYGTLAIYNNMLYGLCFFGGAYNSGVLFEYNPATNVYTNKAEFMGTDGANPYGLLTVYNNKMYGVTRNGGTGQGVLFEYDPATALISRKVSFNSSDGYYPGNSMTVFDNKLYGTTSYGGNYSQGTIFEYVPATEVYSKKQDFLGSSSGGNPQGSFVVSNNRLYSTTLSGGVNSSGTVFEYDTLANTITKKADFTGVGNGSVPTADLIKVPAAVAGGQAGSCVSFPAITIDNSNNNSWVPVMDNLGNAVAEIKANGNNLGIVNVQAYINSGTVREDVSKKLYLNRNLTISPQVQPSSAVDIRLYITANEFNALKNAQNSMGQPSGINTINDVGIFKNSENCSAAIDFIANPVTTTAAAWEINYVFTASVNSFSSFYFANKTNVTLPLSLLSFQAVKQNAQHLLSWKTFDEINVKSFSVERSADALRFESIGIKLASTGGTMINTYSFADAQPLAGKNYYRLKMMDIDGKYSYSPVRLLETGRAFTIQVTPNPSFNKKFMIQLNTPGITSEAVLINAEGSVIDRYKPTGSQFQVQVPATGIYFIRFTCSDGHMQTEKLIAY